MKVPPRDARRPAGPFRADQLRSGDPYELSNGHPVYCAPGGQRHGRGHVVGTLPLATDPRAEQIGADVGHAPEQGMLRAPDLSIGGVDDRPGWSQKAPSLAVEYADVGTNEADLRAKIDELLAAGTRWVWVVRLVGPRRVEVHAESGVRTLRAGEVLTAPGALKNPVPVDALFDRDAAFRVALTNLLQRQGYADLDDVLAPGRAAGIAEGEARGRVAGAAEGEARGRAESVLAVLAARGLAVPDRVRATVLACRDQATLARWLARALTVRSASALLRDERGARGKRRA